MLPGRGVTSTGSSPSSAGTLWYHSHQVSHEQVRARPARRAGREPAEPRPARRRRGRRPATSTTAAATLNGVAGLTTARRASPATGSGCGSSTPTTGCHGLGDRRRRTGCSPSTAPTSTEPGALDRRRVPLPAGGRVDLGFTVPEGGVRVDFGGSTALVARRRPDRRRPGASRPRPARPAGLRRAGRARLRPDARRTGASTTGSASGPASSTAGPACGGRSTATSSPTCRCTWSRRATSSSSRSRTTAARPTRCTCTATTRWCCPATASRATGSPVVGRLARGRRRRVLRDRVPRRQPRALDGPLPQPAARRRGPGRAPDVRRRHVVVP